MITLTLPPPLHMMSTELRSTTFGYHGNESLPCRQEDEEEGEGGEEEGWLGARVASDHRSEGRATVAPSHHPAQLSSSCHRSTCKWEDTTWWPLPLGVDTSRHHPRHNSCTFSLPGSIHVTTSVTRRRRRSATCHRGVLSWTEHSVQYRRTQSSSGWNMETFWNDDDDMLGGMCVLALSTQ